MKFARTRKAARQIMFGGGVVVGWVVIWMGIVAAVAVDQESLGFTVDHASEIPPLALYYAALTLQLPVVLAVGFVAARRGAQHLSRLTGDAVNWGVFSLIVIALPAAMVIAVRDLDHSHQVFAVLAQVNATLAIAIVVDARNVLALAAIGADRPTQMGVRLGFLMLFAMGTLFSATGAVYAESDPPEGVSYDWALIGSLAYALVAVIAALVVLAVNAGGRLLGFVADSSDTPTTADTRTTATSAPATAEPPTNATSSSPKQEPANRLEHSLVAMRWTSTIGAVVAAVALIIDFRRRAREQIRNKSRRPPRNE